jgi:mannan endo-1,4-beta-mannosidase
VIRRSSWLIVISAACLLLTASCAADSPMAASGEHAAPSAPRLTIQARPSSLLGVFEPGTPGSYQPVMNFAAAVGESPDVVLYYGTFGVGFSTKFAREALAHGAELLVQWQPTNTSLAAIAAGKYDAYLHSYGNEVRAFGYPVIIGFAHEMNANWYSWGTAHVPPATWVAAWRRVVTAFRAAGATNVTWLWTIHHSKDTAELRAYWPGASYVTWVGIDGYFEVPSDSYTSVFGVAVDAVRTFTNKPILLAEVGAGPLTGKMPEDIAALYAGIRQQHLLGLVWFDADQHDGVPHQDWRLEGNSAALAAFRQGALSMHLQHT